MRIAPATSDRTPGPRPEGHEADERGHPQVPQPHVDREQRDAPTNSPMPSHDVGGATQSPYAARASMPTPANPAKPNPGWVVSERQSRQAQDEQEVDHRRRGHTVGEPLDRIHVAETDLDGPLSGLGLGGRDPCLGA